MSTLKADAVTSQSTNGDLTISGNGTGVPDLEAGFKVGSVAGVPTASIRDDAVTLAKLASGTDGELITWDASGDPAAVAVGTATHILTSNGAGAAPTFQAAAGGGAWTLISSVAASDSSSIAFTSGIDSTYDTYVILAEGIVAATDDKELNLRTSSDGGSSYDSGGSDYFYITDEIEGASSIAATANSFIRLCVAGAGNASGESLSCTIYMRNPSNSGLQTLFNATGVFIRATGTLRMNWISAVRSSVAIVDAIEFHWSVGNITSGTFSLYGIAKT